MKDALQKTFIELIAIPEVYPNESDIIDYIESRYKNTNVQIVRDSFNNVILKVAGGGKPLMLSTHMDVPEPNPNVEFSIDNNIIKSNGKSILGADPKSGLAILLELLTYITINDINTRPIEFVLTRGEEAGLIGAQHLDFSLLNSKEGIVLDEDGGAQNIIYKAPGYYQFDFNIIGKTAHAVYWRDGNNVLLPFSKFVAANSLGELSHDVTFNIGMLKSGTARNSVPGTLQCKAELRSFDSELLVSEGEMLERNLEKICKTYRCNVSFESGLQFKGFEIDVDSQGIITQVKDVMISQNIKPNIYETYGGSDANIFNAKGIETITLGSGYYNAHAYDEFVNLAEMEEIFSVLLRLVSN